MPLIGPNEFTLFGITYLMAAPSAFSTDVKDAAGNVITPAIVHQGDEQITAFLQEAGITDSTAVNLCIALARLIDTDAVLSDLLSKVHNRLQSSDFSMAYSPTPCPSHPASVAIMHAMALLTVAMQA